ncbi:MAG: 1,4-dihydroxy-2-naphthoate octaprenyltransferase [Duncaniella sp.]|nr:1,4-dihydroxy-2-naphthoate octaprenyltransferase [Duncaniella sp.]HBI57633.1 1,4-dihydroxy-2-naphthoate octaprenyltransferase [Porphyromonadaceae bacterium]
MSKMKCWVEAMRLRTLPVSLAGVLFGVAMAVADGGFKAVPALLCFLFALLAQIASNFANEYYDFKAGLDRVGRDGPRRGVTEGDITPGAMKAATFATLGAACVTGCVLVALYGQWWMYVVGVLTALAVIAYSAGPYPLSRNGLGEVAVVFFFGIIPVTLTYYLETGLMSAAVVAASAGIGLMGANVLIVNNYRDADDDAAVGKRTLAVKLGRNAVAVIYLLNGILALVLTWPEWIRLAPQAWIVPLIYLLSHVFLYGRLRSLTGKALNPLLGGTAVLMLFYAVGYAVAAG